MPFKAERERLVGRGFPDGGEIEVDVLAERTELWARLELGLRRLRTAAQETVVAMLSPQECGK
jgi:hypothetical protein